MVGDISHKANIQWYIGLIAASSHIVIVTLLYVLGDTVLQNMILLSLVMPIAYFVPMVRKRYRQTLIVYLVWLTGWLFSFTLSLLDWAGSVDLESGCLFGFIAFYLDMIINWPAYILPVMIAEAIADKSTIVHEEPMRITISLAFLALLWIGVKGLGSQKRVLVSMGASKPATDGRFKTGQ